MIDFVTILVNLLLVFVILFIYRQYDRRSRALDKIKKFVDIAKDNLEDFIEDKTKEINNLAVDMEAYQRSSIEIIKKIDEVQQKIKNKSNDFAEVEKKIAYHDSMLKELDDMTLKVQDNIQRLQVDGKIVDKLSKTLKNFNVQIDSIDSRLISVFEKFDKKNRENLEAIKIESWEKFDITVKDLNLRMNNLDQELISYQESLVMLEERKNEILDKGNDKLANEFKEFLFKIESSIDNYNKKMEESFFAYEDKYKSIENYIESILEKAKSRVNEKEDFILTRLNEELQLKFDEVFMYVNERSEQMKDKLEDKLIFIDNEISSVSSVFKDNAYSRLNSIEETIKQEIRQYEEQVADIFDQFRVQIESNVREIYKEYDNKINQFNNDIRERIEISLDDANSRMESVENNVKTLLDDLDEDSNKIYVEFKTKVEGDIDKFSESVFSRMNKIGGELETKILNIETDVQDKMLKLNNELYADFKKINDRLISDYSYLDESINSRYEALIKSLSLKSSDLENQIESKYKNIVDKLEGDIDNFSTRYNEKFDRIFEKSNIDYHNFEITSKKLEDEIRSLNDLLVKDFEILRGDFESNLISISDDISKEISSLKNNYSDDIGRFVSEMESTKLKYEEWQERVNSNLENIESHLNKTNEEFLSLIEVQRSRGKELSENIFNELSEHIKNKSMDVHSNWKEELIALNKSLLDIKISSEELLLSASSKMESLERDISERFEYVSSKTEDLEISVLEKYKELKDMSYTKGDEILLGIKEFIDNQVEIIHDKVIMALNGLNEGFSNKEELIRDKIEEFEYRLKDFKLEGEDILNSFRTDLDSFIETRVQKISEIKNENQKQIDGFLSTITEDILSRKDMLNVEIDSKLNDWQRRLSEITVNIENILSSGKVDINLVDSEMTLKIKELKTTIEGLDSYYLEKIDEFRHQGSIYSDELLKNIITHFEADTKEIEENLSKKFAKVLEKSEEFVKEVDSLLQDKRTDITSFQANIDITLDSLSSRFNDLNKEINEKYNEVILNSRGYSEILSNKLENEIVYEIEDINRKLTDKINVMSKNINEELQSFKSSFDMSKYQVENFEVKIKNLIENEEIRISKFLEEIEQQYEDRKKEAINYKKIMDNDVIQLKEQFAEIINDLKNNIEDKSEFLNDLYKERFKIIENNLEERYSTFLIESEGAIAKIRDEVYKTITDNDEKLRIKISEMDRNFEIVEERSKEILEFEESLKKRISENNDTISYQFDVIKTDIEKEMKAQFDSYMIKTIVSIDEEITKYESGINNKISSLKLIENSFREIEKELKDKIGRCHNEINNVIGLKYSELEDKYNEKHDLIESKINERSSYVEGLILNKYSKLENEYNEKQELIENSFREIEKELKDKIGRCHNEINNVIGLKYSELEDKYDEKHDLIESKINERSSYVEGLILNKYSELENKYNEKQELIENSFREIEKELKDKIGRCHNEINNVIGLKYSELEDKYINMQRDMENKLNSYISDLEEGFNHSNTRMTREIREQLDKLEELKLGLNNIEKDIIKLKEDSYQNVSSHLKLIEEDFFEDLSKKSEHLKTSIENFVELSDQRIENLERDIINSLEDKSFLIRNFKVEVEQELVRNKENFYLEFSREFDNRKRDTESRINSMETSVASRIDKFIEFIDNRQNNIDSWFLKVKDDMKNWQESTYKALEERTDIAEISVKRIESDISVIENTLRVIKDTVDQRTEEIFGNLQEDIKKFKNSSSINLKNIADEFKDRVLNIEKVIDSKMESLDEKVNFHIKEIGAQMEAMTLSQQQDIEVKIGDANQKLEYEFGLIVERLEKEKQEIADKFLDNKDKFEYQMNIMKNNILEISEKLSTYRIDIEKTIRESYDSFSNSIRQDYISFENEIRNSFSYSEEEIRVLKDGLNIRVNQMEVELKSMYEKMIKGIEDDVSQFKLKILDYDSEFGHFLDKVKSDLISYKADLREEFDSHYATISVQVEKYKKLEVELEKNNEILNEIYSFKDKLENLWGSLAGEMGLVQNYKKEFEKINKEINNIQNQSSDILDIFNDLKTHQAAFKDIREEFNQFLEFYASFKDRYKKFRETYDEIQIYKTKLKEIRDEQNRIFDNYDRIINKESILKTTIESVDKNFDLIIEIENRMQVLVKESLEFQESLGELKVIIEELMVNKNLSQEALGNAQALKGILVEIENKLEHTRNIREKIAKSETRLENLNFAAEERIKTLGILVKTESKYKDNVGLNNETVRDSVVKLMRQGWSASEISRATKLSVGEVELILELGISSNKGED
ncbi:hypothetical protein F0310_02525 [Borrelia sp. A-FGy1]|uniref:SpiroCoCo family coiled-coil protein n=1 Tax=Borrelia sp. A-FGy1 TaxID=2608247 RepID=UPI0015F3548E|nr:hypothetical protein [Borrelia sp. A-FGy1]QMU99282.1 hypothetical protein F0310_02525 [Borrelia sp. A-FGy1]